MQRLQNLQCLHEDGVDDRRLRTDRHDSWLAVGTAFCYGSFHAYVLYDLRQYTVQGWLCVRIVLYIKIEAKK